MKFYRLFLIILTVLFFNLWFSKLNWETPRGSRVKAFLSSLNRSFQQQQQQSQIFSFLSLYFLYYFFHQTYREWRAQILTLSCLLSPLKSGMRWELWFLRIGPNQPFFEPAQETQGFACILQLPGIVRVEGIDDDIHNPLPSVPKSKKPHNQNASINLAQKLLW